MRPDDKLPSPDRRRFLAAVGISVILPRPAFAQAGVRKLAFDNIHTGEKLRIDYWADGNYLADALLQVNRLLRDFRSGEVHPIEPALLDLICGVQGKLETDAPVTVISGYRSPATNAMLREEHAHSGVASQSLHMKGMAIDIRIAGRSLKALHDAAQSQRGGGVGYYPASDFVHIDVGRIRSWSGI